MTEVLARAEGVGKVYRQGTTETRVLRDVSVTLEAGELVLLMGPSGSGKTTLLSILAGLLQPSEGEVELCGTRLDTLPQAAVTRVRRRHVGFVFQSYCLFGALSALDNVAEPLAMKGRSIRRAREEAMAALESVGMGPRAHHLPADLSGGEKQRVAVARALAGDPRIIFGDEPTAALDGRTAASVVALLQEAVSPTRSVLLVTHDQRLEPYAHRVLHLADGALVGEDVVKLPEAPASTLSVRPRTPS